MRSRFAARRDLRLLAVITRETIRAWFCLAHRLAANARDPGRRAAVAGLACSTVFVLFACRGEKSENRFGGALVGRWSLVRYRHGSGPCPTFEEMKDFEIFERADGRIAWRSLKKPDHVNDLRELDTPESRCLLDRQFGPAYESADGWIFALCGPLIEPHHAPLEIMLALANAASGRDLRLERVEICNHCGSRRTIEVGGTSPQPAAIQRLSLNLVRTSRQLGSVIRGNQWSTPPPYQTEKGEWGFRFCAELEVD